MTTRRGGRPSTEARAAVRDELRLRELDRRATATRNSLGSLGLRARHTWSGSTSIPAGGAVVPLTLWTIRDDAGVAEHRGGGLFRLLQPGNWALQLTAISDAQDAGNFGIALRLGTGELPASGYCGAGFPGAGFDDRSVSWVQPLGIEDVTADITAVARWFSSGAAARDVTYRLQLHLLAGELATTGGTGPSGPAASPAT